MSSAHEYLRHLPVISLVLLASLLILSVWLHWIELALPHRARLTLQSSRVSSPIVLSDAPDRAGSPSKRRGGFDLGHVSPRLICSFCCSELRGNKKNSTLGDEKRRCAMTNRCRIHAHQSRNLTEPRRPPPHSESHTTDNFPD